MNLKDVPVRVQSLIYNKLFLWGKVLTTELHGKDTKQNAELIKTQSSHLQERKSMNNGVWENSSARVRLFLSTREFIIRGETL